MSNPADIVYFFVFIFIYLFLAYTKAKNIQHLFVNVPSINNLHFQAVSPWLTQLDVNSLPSRCEELLCLLLLHVKLDRSVSFWIPICNLDFCMLAQTSYTRFPYTDITQSELGFVLLHTLPPILLNAPELF